MQGIIAIRFPTLYGKGLVLREQEPGPQYLHQLQQQQCDSTTKLSLTSKRLLHSLMLYTLDS